MKSDLSKRSVLAHFADYQIHLPQQRATDRTTIGEAKFPSQGAFNALIEVSDVIATLQLNAHLFHLENIIAILYGRVAAVTASSST